MGHALKDGRGDIAPTIYLLFKEIVYLIVGFTIVLGFLSILSEKSRFGDRSYRGKS